MAEPISSVRLTDYATGGGCGCKLSPALLREILAGMPAAGPFESLLVGKETGDDAAVWRIDERTAVVATTDFFNPVVDDPGDFGRIAATNALSDVYAMGGRPIMALAILGFPRQVLPASVAAAIVAGGAAACAAAGVPVAGGHSIDNPEPIYGLAVVGLVDPSRVMTNKGARAGDALVLTKGLGIGIYGAALRKRRLGPELYEAMILSTTTLNRFGIEAAGIGGVHAMTDCTGFGLLGHALEMCEGAGLGLVLSRDAVPLLPGVQALAEQGIMTGASGRNWESYGAAVRGAEELDRVLLTDPQTSGGLLIAVAPERVEAVLPAGAAVVGWFEEGRGIEVRGSAPEPRWGRPPQTPGSGV